MFGKPCVAWTRGSLAVACSDFCSPSQRFSADKLVWDCHHSRDSPQICLVVTCFQCSSDQCFVRLSDELLKRMSCFYKWRSHNLTPKRLCATVLTVAASLSLARVGSKSPLIDLSSRDTCAQPPLPSPEVDLELQDKQRGARAFVRWHGGAKGKA